MNPLIILWILFFVSRLIIWFFPPKFTDVVYSYHEYARIWNEGYTPYLKHLFEYPPANIILFYLPRLIDKLRIVDFLNYRFVYRLILLGVDIIVFIFAIKTLKKTQKNQKIIFISLLYYILSTLKAKDFVYDTMDLVFIGCFFMSVVIIKLKKYTWQNRFWSWFFFWLSTAFKYITFPLFIFNILLMKKGGKKFKKEVIASLISFLVVWGLPLIIFRSSLSVSFVYHFKRGFQVESVPAGIIRYLNSWKKTESFIEVFKNYDIVGPITTKLTPLFSLIFIFTMFGFVVYSFKKALILSLKPTNEFKEKLKISLIYLILFLLTSKVFSTPFNLWLSPLLTIYPFKTVKSQIKTLFFSFLLITISMTFIPNYQFLIFDVHTIRGVIKPLFLLLILEEIRKT